MRALGRALDMCGPFLLGSRCSYGSDNVSTSAASVIDCAMLPFSFRSGLVNLAPTTGLYPAALCAGTLQNNCFVVFVCLAS